MRLARQLRELRRHTALVPAIAYAPDGAQLLTGSWDGTLQLWQTADGAAGLTQPGWTSRALAVAASPIQPIAAVAYFDGKARSLSTVDAAAQATLDAHSGSVNCVAFLPDGAALATAGEDGMIRLWRIADGAKIGEIDGAGGAIRSLAVDNAGEVVAAVGADGRVRQWHLADGAPVGVEIGDPISNATSVAFAPDGTLAVGFARGRIHLYNLAALQPRLVLSGHTDTVNSLAFSPDGQHACLRLGRQYGTTVGSGGRHTATTIVRAYRSGP